MNTEEYRQWYSAYLENDMQDLPEEAVRALESDPTCRRELEQMRLALTALQQVPPPLPAPDFVQRVTAAVTEEILPPTRRPALAERLGRLFENHLWLPLLSGATIFVFGFALAWVFLGHGPSAEDRLAQAGYIQIDGSWLPVDVVRHRGNGDVWIDGEWHGRGEMTRALLEREYIRHSGRWITPEERDHIVRGELPYQGRWLTPDELVTEQLQARGLVREGEAWISAEEHRMKREGMVYAGGEWVDPEAHAAEVMRRNGFVRHEGGWRHETDMGKAAEGLVRFGDEWCRPEDLVTAWLEDEGYVRRGTFWIAPSPNAAMAGRVIEGMPLEADAEPMKLVDSGGLSSVIVNRRKFSLHLYDRFNIDGDDIDVWLDGKRIAEGLKLDARPGAELPLELESGGHMLMIHVKGEGTIGPSTATLRIDAVARGNEEQTFVLARDEVAFLMIFVKPEAQNRPSSWDNLPPLNWERADENERNEAKTPDEPNASKKEQTPAERESGRRIDELRRRLQFHIYPLEGEVEDARPPKEKQ